MLEADVVELLESGCGLLIGLVTAAGKPLAARGWGLTVLSDGTRARILLGGEELGRLGYPPGGEISTMVAVTGSSVLTLRSIQLKGPITATRLMDDDDADRLRSYCNDFFDDVAAVDSFPRHLMERMIPPAMCTCEFDIVEVYNQTPGPNAGARVEATAIE